MTGLEFEIILFKTNLAIILNRIISNSSNKFFLLENLEKRVIRKMSISFSLFDDFIAS